MFLFQPIIFLDNLIASFLNPTTFWTLELNLGLLFDS